jgi:Planctomycete cytochrome C
MQSLHTISLNVIKKITPLIVCFVLVFAASCKHYPLNTDCILPAPGTIDTLATLKPCDPDSVYFNNTILPLFVSNCAKAGCHDPITHEEGLILNSYSSIMGTGEIQPGDPAEGDIMDVITQNDPTKIMPPPPNSALSAQQINLISMWISQGAQNNYCNSCDTSNVSYLTKVKPLLDLKCKGCHNPSLVSGGVDLSTYSGAVASGQSGALLGAVKHVVPYSKMPKGGQKLPACEIDIISIWITNQYPQ